MECRRRAFDTLLLNWKVCLFNGIISYVVHRVMKGLLEEEIDWNLDEDALQVDEDIFPLFLTFTILKAIASMGWASFSLKLARQQPISPLDLYCLPVLVRPALLLRRLLLVLLCELLMLLGFMLFFAPGLLVYVDTALIYFVMLDREGLSVWNILVASHEMMRGNRMRYLMMMLSLGLFVVLAVVFQVLWVGLQPYMYLVMAHFYLEVRPKEEAAAQEEQHGVGEEQAEQELIIEEVVEEKEEAFRPKKEKHKKHRVYVTEDNQLYME